LLAHGVGGRADLPIPEELFAWAAVIVLVVSFLALASLWPRPRLEDGGPFRPFPEPLARVLLSRPVDIACGAIGVVLLAVTVWSGLRGQQTPATNFATVFVFVVFWVGLVPVSLVFGDVFRAFNPWRAIGRAVAWVAQTAARGPVPAPLAYPERLGHWPAAAGLLAFVILELVASNGDRPENVAIATLIYSAATFVGMALYGVERWCDRGEAFSVYFNLFSRIAPVGVRDGRLGLRRVLSGLAGLRPGPGTVALLGVMIGSVSFDGLKEKTQWREISPDLSDFFGSLGLSPEKALEAAFLTGLIAAILIVLAFFRLGIAGVRSIGGGMSTMRLERSFVHSLVPIALAYVVAHYLTLVLIEGQRIFYLFSDPLGEGTDYFGTAGYQVDLGVIGANATWYWQVGFVVAGHVAALASAHDRAIALYDEARLAVRSQYWMLVVMAGFTTLALWLLAQENG
jgi:hypothetical protein